MELSRDLFLTGGKRKFAIFEVFREYLKEFSIYFLLNLHSSKILSNSCGRHHLLWSGLVSLESRLKVPILAIFDDFWHFSSCPFWEKAFELGQWFFYENLVQSMYFMYNKGFFNYADHLAKNQYNADQIFEKSRNIRALVWPL